MNDKMNDNDQESKEQVTDGKEAVSSLSKTVFSDEEAMETAVLKSVADNVLNNGKNKVAPSFFMDDGQTVKIDLDIWSDPDTGRILSVTKRGEIDSEAMEKYVLKTEHWFEFSVPNFDDVCIYRQKSSRYLGKEQVTDINLFRNFILLGHLQGWSLSDKNGNPVEVKREKDGSLSLETVGWINKLHTVVWDIVFTLFERQTLIG